LPYSPLNIKEVSARGGTLNTVWAHPFFRSLREWQLRYKQENRNGLAPCPNRDHHSDLQRMLMEHEPDPIDTNAAAALLEADYVQGLAQYDETYQSLTRDLWEAHYVRRTPAKSTSKDAVPDMVSPEAAAAEGQQLPSKVLESV